MHRFLRPILIAAALSSVLPSPEAAAQAAAPVVDATAKPPAAARKPKDVTVHGDRRIDDYFWLRERDNPEVLAYLRAEADYTAAWFKPLEPFRQALYEEMVGRIQQDDVQVPARDGAWWYRSRTVQGGQYPIYGRQHAAGADRHYDANAPEQVLLDLNEMAKGRKFLSLGGMQISPDGRRLAYSTDSTGARDFLLEGRDLVSGKPLPLHLEKVSSFQWAADNRTLFYVTTDAAKRSNRLWRVQVDARRASKPVMLFEEKDELFDIDLGRTQDQRYLLLSSRSKNTSEQRVLDAAHPLSAWKVLLPRQTGREYDAEHHEGTWYVRVNDTGRNFRLVTMPVARPSLQAAHELIAARPDAMLESMLMTRHHLVVEVRDQGSMKLRVVDFADGKQHDIAFDEPVYTAYLDHNLEYDTDTVRFGFESLVTPASVYDYRLDTGERMLRKVQPVLGGYDPKRYASERVWATASDGTRIPISMVYRKDLHQAGVPQPTLLYGYGSYGIPSDPHFASHRLSLLDRGAVFAIAHIRGGGDLGKTWYEAGKLDKKMNTFTDFVAAADALVAQKVTTPQQLIIHGGSAGGLLMGAVTNLRPELFKAVVAEVPFVDVINTMLDETLPLTTGEFIEWGNPKIEAQYRWMRAYSPYDNLKPGAYPAVFVRTGFNDSQVSYWEPAKYVAKLRALKTDNNPVLFDINMDAGHGGASGRFDSLKERSRIYTFMLQQWGLLKPPVPLPSQ
jgi:oligopeptidase B